MNVLISGASGFIGSKLARRLAEAGHNVKSLCANDYALAEDIFAKKLEGADAVINLSGANIAARWSEDYKKIIYESRIGCTRKIVSAIKSNSIKPSLLINASAVGIYESGFSHDEINFRYGKDFLASLCKDWEAEALRAREAGLRTVIFRLAMVLDKSGGALKKMLMPFSMGLGGVIGEGSQYMSWIVLSDLLSAFEFIIAEDKLEGVFNAASPGAVTNREFTEILAKTLKRPAFFRVPEFMLKLIFSDGAKIMCEGSKVYPRRLIDSGYKFEYQDLKTALNDIINGGPKR